MTAPDQVGGKPDAGLPLVRHGATCRSLAQSPKQLERRQPCGVRHLRQPDLLINPDVEKISRLPDRPVFLSSRFGGTPIAHMPFEKPRNEGEIVHFSLEGRGFRLRAVVHTME